MSDLSAVDRRFPRQEIGADYLQKGTLWSDMTGDQWRRLDRLLNHAHLAFVDFEVNELSILG